jgi:hypothetical protein
MADIQLLRTGLVTNLGTIPGLRTSLDIPDNPNPPVAIVQLVRAEFHQDFANGMTEYTFAIQVLVGRQDDRTAQRKLDGYCSSDSATSVKKAVESNRTLNGQAYDCVVTEMSSYGSVLVNDTTYLAAEFAVRVLAS